jgi:hypothetical protein
VSEDDFERQRTQLYRKVFFEESGDGRLVLGELMALCFWHAPTFVAGMPDQTAFNEGKRSVLDHILIALQVDETDLYAARRSLQKMIENARTEMRMNPFKRIPEEAA